MFEIVCEVANTSGKILTIETSIPEAEKPDVQMLKSGQQMGVFASPTRSTVKITVVSVEDADRIDELGAANDKLSCDALQLYDRIEKLEAALDDVAGYLARADWYYLKPETRKALEGKDD